MFIRLNKVKTVVPNIKDLSESARQNSKLKQRISQYDVLSQNQASVDSKQNTLPNLQALKSKIN